MGYYNDTVAVYELKPKRQWGRGDILYATMDPLMWSWARVGKVEQTDRTQGMGTTWAELLFDIPIEIAFYVRDVTETVTTLQQDASTFGWASGRVLRHMGLYGRQVRASQVSRPW